jgi:FtsH-binding integral membrane protein
VSGKGDLLALTGIALLAGVSIPCLLLLVPAYARQGDRVHLAITLATAVVLVLAAAGVFIPH